MIQTSRGNVCIPLVLLSDGIAYETERGRADKTERRLLQREVGGERAWRSSRLEVLKVLGAGVL
jgi:hypothetical protein